MIRYSYVAFHEANFHERVTKILGETFEMALEFLKPKYRSFEVHGLEGRFRKYANDIWEYFGWSRSTCTLNWHLPVHYPRLIKLWGPLIRYWCWVIERLNQTCKAIIDSGNHRNVDNQLMIEVSSSSFTFPFLSFPSFSSKNIPKRR